MEGVLVTAETRFVDGAWECVAWPGEGVVSVRAGTADDVEALFVDTWNAVQGTSFTPEGFGFIRQ